MSASILEASVNTVSPHHVRFVGLIRSVFHHVTAASFHAPAFDETFKSRYSDHAVVLSVFVPINAAVPAWVNRSSLVE